MPAKTPKTQSGFALTIVLVVVLSVSLVGAYLFIVSISSASDSLITAVNEGDSVSNEVETNSDFERT